MTNIIRNVEDLTLINRENHLSRWYIPNDLVIVDENENNFHEYSDPELKPMISKRVLISFLKLQRDAIKDGYNIIIGSGYRSYDYQEALWNQFFKEYHDQAKGKNDVEKTKIAFELTAKRVAIPGASEHQSGLAFDIACFRKGKYSDEIEDSLESKWMDENAYKYGFILRYPKGKESITGYDYEPWHFRYVGYPVSLEFYDGKYKTLEEYHKEKKLTL